MANWLGNLLKPLRSDAPPSVALGAFGKHPGWNDHIEDIGLETEAMLTARQLLYVQGIGGVIDTAAWEKLPPAEALPEFGHLLAWFGEGEMIVARLWSSRDGKGRDKYPMVLCAHAARLDPATALRAILPVLKEAEASCRATTSGDAVRQALDVGRQRLRSVLLEGASSGPPPLPGASSASVDGLAGAIGLSSSSEQWQRTLYALESQLSAFAGGKLPEPMRRLTLKMTESPVTAQQVRLPQVTEERFAEAILFWRSLVTGVIGAQAPLLFLLPLSQFWLDLIVGYPTPKQLVCLRAAETAIPLAGNIPYSLPAGFAEKASRALATAAASSAA